MNITRKEKVVLVVSNDGDYSAKLVSDWVSFYCSSIACKVVCFNTSKDTINLNEVVINNKRITYVLNINDGYCEFHSNQITSIFFRNGLLNLTNSTGARSNRGMASDVSSRLNNYFMAYEKNVKGLVLNCFDNANKIGRDNGSFINKIFVLEVAQKNGLNVPSTLLTSKKKQLKAFLRQHKSIITKSMALGLSVYDSEDNSRYLGLTSEINVSDLDKIPDKFPLSLFQEQISKEFELRVFYLNGSFFTSALLSQFDENTKIDYRNYNNDKPMRVVPYLLPKWVEKKLSKIMNDLGLETGSFDLIYSTKKQYYFLEVNPSGQYGYNSDKCNFYLDREIAKSLVK